MNYYDSFLDKISGPIPEGTGKNGGNTPSKSGRPSVREPAKTAERVFVVSVGSQPEDRPDFEPAQHECLPLWPPRPAELARWPIEWRERWGRLANRLEDEGVRFPESERRAFDLVKAEKVEREA